MTSKSCPWSCICCPSVPSRVSSGDAPTCPPLHRDHWPGCSSVARTAVGLADGEEQQEEEEHEEGQSFSFCPSATLTMDSGGALTVDTLA